MRFNRCALFIVASLMVGGAGRAGPLDDDVSAYKEAKLQASGSLPDQAQYHVGFLYVRGPEAPHPQDYQEARRSCLKAAARDDPRAEFDLGVLAMRGLDAPKDDGEAEQWFRRAADHGVAAAQFNLGVMYAHSLGVREDYVLAHMWFSLAAEQGEPGAKEALDAATTRMSLVEIAIAQRLAKDWKPLTWALRL